MNPCEAYFYGACCMLCVRVYAKRRPLSLQMWVLVIDQELLKLAQKWQESKEIEEEID